MGSYSGNPPGFWSRPSSVLCFPAGIIEQIWNAWKGGNRITRWPVTTFDVVLVQSHGISHLQCEVKLKKLSTNSAEILSDELRASDCFQFPGHKAHQSVSPILLTGFLLAREFSELSPVVSQWTLSRKTTRLVCNGGLVICIPLACGALTHDMAWDQRKDVPMNSEVERFACLIISTNPVRTTPE